MPTADDGMSETTPSRAGWRFDGFELDLLQRELRGADARAIAVEARVFDLLVLLIDERARALSKQELLDRVWGRRIVSEGALTQAVFKLRRLLGEDDPCLSHVRTVRGHGLQWVGHVDALQPHPAADINHAANAAVSGATRPRWRFGVRYGAATAALIAVIAAFAWFMPARPANGGEFAITVLPVAMDAGENMPAWAPQGLASLLANLISDQELVATPVPNGVAVPAGDRAAFERVSSALGAKALLSSHLSRKGTLYELDVRVYRPDRGDWSDTLLGAEPAALAVDAAVRVRHQFARDVDLPHQELKPSDTGIGERSGYLAETYARGLDAYTSEDYTAAQRYLQICIEQDPSLLWARWYLAEAQFHTGQTAQGRDAGLALLDLPATQADARLHQSVLRFLGYAEDALGNNARAERYLGAAQDEADRGGWIGAKESTHIAHAIWLIRRDRFDQAVAELGRVRADLEPGTMYRQLLSNALVAMGAAYAYIGNADAARAVDLRAMDLDQAMGNRREAALVARNLGGVDAQQWRYVDALEVGMSAQELTAERNDDSGLAQNSGQLARSLSRLQRGSIAIDYARAAVAFAARAHKPEDEAIEIIQLDKVYFAAGRLAEAAHAAHAAEISLRKTGRTNWLVVALKDQADVALARHEVTTAATFVDEIFRIADAPDLHMLALQTRAALRTAQHDRKGADDDYRAAIALAAASHDDESIHELRLIWACTLLDAGQVPAAASLLARIEDWRVQSPDVLKLEIALAKAQGQPVSQAQAELDRLLASPVIAQAVKDAPHAIDPLAVAAATPAKP